jgi:rRNA maturation endonuclease Nob1
MVSLVQQLRRWLADEPVLYECRNCGTTVDEDCDACHSCGAADIARYDLE